MILDLDRSRAKIGVVVEADAQNGRLRVVGDPTYDVHLVRSPIQRPFPLPKPEHLVDARFSPQLFEALTGFAESDGQPPQTINGLRALYQAVRANTPGEAARKFEDVRRLYQTHLRPGAPAPIAANENTCAAVTNGIQAIDEQTKQIFDVAREAAKNQIHLHYETPVWRTALASGGVEAAEKFDEHLRQQGGEATRLVDFRDLVQEFEGGRESKPWTALWHSASPSSENRGRDAPRDAQPPTLGDEVIRETRRRIEAVRDIREQCFQSLEPLIQELAAAAAGLLPAFTQQLRDEANQHSGSVNVSELF